MEIAILIVAILLGLCILCLILSGITFLTELGNSFGGGTEEHPIIEILFVPCLLGTVVLSPALIVLIIIGLFI